MNINWVKKSHFYSKLLIKLSQDSMIKAEIKIRYHFFNQWDDPYKLNSKIDFSVCSML